MMCINMIKIIIMSALQIKNTSESDPHSYDLSDVLHFCV